MPKTIVVAYDFSEIAERALDLAIELAHGRGDNVTLVHAVPLPPVPMGPEVVVAPFTPTPATLHSVEESLRAVAQRRGIEANVTAMIASNVGESIVDKADQLGADMIVLGTHGRGVVARALMGSVADFVVRHAKCPVVTVRGHKGESVQHTAAP